MQGSRDVHADRGPVVAESDAVVLDLRAQIDTLTEQLAAARQALAITLAAQQSLLLGGADPTQDVHADLRRLQTAIAEIESSEAYRVGRAVTWPARRAKQFLRRS